MEQPTISGASASEDRWAGLLAQHERLVHWVVRRHGGGLPYSEALHAGRIGLWQALRGYDPSRGTRFSTYAVPVIRHTVWRAVVQARREAATPPAVLPPPAPAADVVLEQAEVAAALRAVVGQLPPRLQHVVVAHWGLADAPPASLAAIGRRWGISRQRVHQLHVQALVALAHPEPSRPLRGVLDRQTRADYQQALAQGRAWARAQRARRRRP